MLSKIIFALIACVCVEARTFPDIQSNKPEKNWDDKRHEIIQNTKNLRSEILKNSLDIFDKYKDVLNISDFNKCLNPKNEVLERMNCIKDIVNKTRRKERNYYRGRYSIENDYDGQDKGLDFHMDTVKLFNMADRNKKHKNKRNFDSELIKKALELAKEIKNSFKSNAFKKCLKKKSERNKINCIKEFIYKIGREGRQGHINKYLNGYDDSQDTPDRGVYNKKDFSQDYLDVGDLLRKNTKANKKRYVFKVAEPNKYVRFDYDLSKLRKFNRKDDGIEINSKDMLRKKYDSSESSDSEEKLQIKQIERDNDDSSDEQSSDEKLLRKKKANVNPLVYYMQGSSRLYGEDGRRRLPYFFPKRYHWDEDDMKELKNYWFQGPQGKYWGHYKTQY